MPPENSLQQSVFVSLVSSLHYTSVTKCEMIWKILLPFKTIVQPASLVGFHKYHWMLDCISKKILHLDSTWFCYALHFYCEKIKIAIYMLCLRLMFEWKRKMEGGEPLDPAVKKWRQPVCMSYFFLTTHDENEDFESDMDTHTHTLWAGMCFQVMMKRHLFARNIHDEYCIDFFEVLFKRNW